VVAAVVVAGSVVGILRPFSGRRATGSGATDNASPTSLATVVSRSLSSQTNVNATLGYAEAYTVDSQAKGTLTALPTAGQVVQQGQVLYGVDGNPVVLLFGSTPAWRDLSQGSSGPDVVQLNNDLLALGHASTAQITPGSNSFTSATAAGVEQLQAALGASQTGTLTLGQLVFLPTAARITALSANLGGQIAAGRSVLQATSTARQITVALDAAQQSEVKVGDQVTLTLPNNQTTPGVVSSVGTVATTPPSTSGSTNSGASTNPPTVTVEVNPADPTATGTWDQAPVQVAITTATVNNALVVPVNSLLALAGGGYAVEVVSRNDTRHLVTVSLGIFDDAAGLVQVSSPGLAAGQRIVVPTSR
jgi:HlyD family secretion protein